MGSQKGPRLPKVRFRSHFGLLLGALGEHFWGHFGPKFRNRRDFVDFFVPVFRTRKKERKRGSPGGEVHAIRSRRRMFREGRPSSLRLHFGLHFGVVLGAKFATILPWGRPGGQNRLTKKRLKKRHKKGAKSTAQGSPAYWEGPPPSPYPGRATPAHPLSRVSAKALCRVSAEALCRVSAQALCRVSAEALCRVSAKALAW